MWIINMIFCMIQSIRQEILILNLLPKKKQRIGKVSSTKAEVKQFETVKYVQENKQKRVYISWRRKACPYGTGSSGGTFEKM